MGKLEIVGIEESDGPTIYGVGIGLLAISAEKAEAGRARFVLIVQSIFAWKLHVVVFIEKQEADDEVDIQFDDSNVPMNGHL